MTALDRNGVLVGDATEQLCRLPSASIDCVITSPPYFQLRNYGVAGQIGLEPTVEQWVHELRAVFDEVARVLKPSGSLWLNLGDSYSRGHSYGAAPKSLLLAPERLLLALAADGWIVRNKTIWAKSNPMPSSVTDRLNTTYDVVYFLVRSPRYFFDLDAIREPHRSKGTRSTRTASSSPPAWAGPLAGTQGGLARARADGLPGHRLGKNPGDVWRLPASSYRGAHFATFPEALVQRPLLATCPERVCTRCSQAWRRAPGEIWRLGSPAASGRDRYVRRYPSRWQTLRTLGQMVPCPCGAPALPGVVLDPFFGSGTVGVVAERLGRDWIGIELNPAYAELARSRLRHASRHRDQVAA